MPDRITRLSQYPYVVVRMRCDLCHRAGAYRLARLAESYGAEVDLDAMVRALSADCPWRLKRRLSIWEGCKAFLPDLAAPPEPPHLPPAMAALRVIEGGRVEIQKEPRSSVQRRR